MGAGLDGGFRLDAGALDADADARTEVRQESRRRPRSRLRRLARDARRGARQEGRRRARDRRDAERHAPRDRARVPRRRHPRAVREAADDDGRGGEGSREARLEARPAAGRELRLHRLPDGASGARDGARRHARRGARRRGRVRARPPRERRRHGQPARALALRPGPGRRVVGAGRLRHPRAADGRVGHRPARRDALGALPVDRARVASSRTMRRCSAGWTAARRSGCGPAPSRSATSTD